MAIPTIEQAEESGANMDTITEFVKSNEPTLVDQYGDTRTTLKGAEDRIDQAILQAGGIDVGDYENDPTITASYDYVVFDRLGTPTNWKVKEGVALPYDIDYSTYPTPEQDPNIQLFVNTNGAGNTNTNFPTVGEMQIDTAISEGDLLSVGDSFYVAVADTTTIELQNDLYAKTASDSVLMSWLDVTGVTDESSKIQQLIDAGFKVKLPEGVIKADISAVDGMVLLGSGAPRYDDLNTSAWDNTGTLVTGFINVSNAKGWSIGNMSCDQYSAGGNTLVGVGARTGYGYVKNFNTRANNHGHLYETATSFSNAGYDADSDVIGNVVVENCEHWGGPNGFVTKHHAIKFIRCKTWGVTVQGFVVVSDNINDATTYNRATDTEITDCFSEGLGLGTGGAEGIRIYTQDRFSADPSNDVNTNGVQPVYNTSITGYSFFELAGSPIRIGDGENPSVCNLPSVNTYVDKWRYNTFAFSGITLQHSQKTIISRSEFGAGANVGVSPTRASGVIIEDNNIYQGGNVQTGAEIGFVVVNDNSNTIMNRYWQHGITYSFENTVQTTVTNVEWSIDYHPVRFVINDTFTTLNIFPSFVPFQGKGTVINAMFNGGQWVVLSIETMKSVHEKTVGATSNPSFNWVDSTSKNLVFDVLFDTVAITAVVSGMPYGETVGLHLKGDTTIRALNGWSNVWRFEGSNVSNNLGNPPTSIAAYTKIYMEFYVYNGILIEKSRSVYA